MYSSSTGKTFICIAVLFAVLGMFIVGSRAASAANQAYNYDSINVDISVLENSDMLINEVQTFNFTSGDFHYGFRWIPTDRLESIDNVEVWEGDRQYTLDPSVKKWIDIRKETGGSPGGDNYAYSTWTENDRFFIGWWFPETSNARRTISLKYKVHGGLRIDNPLDQLYWKAIFGDRDTYVGSSKVVVHLPESMPSQQLSIYSYGVPATNQIVDDKTIEFVTGYVPAANELEINIYFPHGIVSGVPAPWQIKLEQQEAYNNNVKPWVNLSLTLFGLVVVPLLGVLWIRRAFRKRGPLPKPGTIFRSQYSPPSDLPPALVALLTGSRAGSNALTSTIFDLANRGILQIVETENQGWFGTRKDIMLMKVKDGERFSFEELLTQTMASGDGKLLSDQRGRHPLLLQDFKKMVERESVRQKLFEEEPSRSIRRLLTPGILLIFAAIFISIMLFVLIGQYAEMIFVPFLACIPIGLAATILSYKLPNLTEAGANESAKWKSFGKYLKKMVKDRQLATDNMNYWDSYFAYAMVFGLGPGWVKQFTRLEAPAPVWFYTAGYSGGEMTPGTISAASVPSLSSISSAFSGMVNMVQGTFSGGSGSSGGGGGGGGGSGGGGGGGGGAG
jgi:uncharacterized membrane protein